MGTGVVAGLAAAGCAMALAAAAQAPADSAAVADTGPAYTDKGQMIFPADYRRWVYLSSGLDMSYVASQTPGMSMFDNVFVDPAAWASFQKTGTWPDKTVMVLEVRNARQNGSINKAGRFQTDRMGAEVHVKDTARFQGGWAFFAFDGEGPGQLLPPTASCYACHTAHAAVDTTFVQFYPTLKPIAAAKGTFSANYLADEAKGKR
jgi:hypothetical protein